MSKLSVLPSLAPDAVDDIYHCLISAHAELSVAESMRLNAKLILLLANVIGDPQIICEAIDRATPPRDLKPDASLLPV